MEQMELQTQVHERAYAVVSSANGAGLGDPSIPASALAEAAGLLAAERHARELRLGLVQDAKNDYARRAEMASRLLASIAPSSAATAASLALAEAETQSRLAERAAAAGADMVAERRQRDAAEALANAEELARRAAQGAGRESPEMHFGRASPAVLARSPTHSPTPRRMSRFPYCQGPPGNTSGSSRPMLQYGGSSILLQTD